MMGVTREPELSFLGEVLGASEEILKQVEEEHSASHFQETVKQVDGGFLDIL